MRKDEIQLFGRVVKSSQDWQRRCLIMREMLRDKGIDASWLFSIKEKELEKEMMKYLSND